MAARLYNAVEVKISDLYPRIPGDGEVIMTLGSSIEGDSPCEGWKYFASSMAVDDGGVNVIKPSLIAVTDPGRWLRIKNFPKTSTSKRVDNYSGTTNASGIYAVTFAIPFTGIANIQAEIIGGTNKESKVVTKINSAGNTTGFSIKIETRNDVLGLLPTFSAVSGRTVDVTVFEI